MRLPDTLEHGTCMRQLNAHYNYGSKGGASVYSVTYQFPDGEKVTLPVLWQSASKPITPIERGIFLRLADGSFVKDDNGNDRAFMAWSEVVAFWPTYMEMRTAAADE